MRSLEGRIRKLEKSLPDDNGLVFVLVIGVNAKSYCLIDGKEVYSGPEFERAEKRFMENLRRNQGEITIIGEPARGVDEDKL
jgi:hypothetical protein